MHMNFAPNDFHQRVIFWVYVNDIKMWQVFLLLIYKIVVGLSGPFESLMFLFCKLPSRCQSAECICVTDEVTLEQHAEPSRTITRLWKWGHHRSVCLDLDPSVIYFHKLSHCHRCAWDFWLSHYTLLCIPTASNFSTLKSPHRLTKHPICLYVIFIIYIKKSDTYLQCYHKIKQNFYKYTLETTVTIRSHFWHKFKNQFDHHFMMAEATRFDICNLTMWLETGKLTAH